MKKLASLLSYFRELWLWPGAIIIAGITLAEVVRFCTGRSPADDVSELLGVILNQSPILWAAIGALSLDGHLYYSLNREEWLAAGRPFMDSAKPILIFIVILMFEYFYLRH